MKVQLLAAQLPRALFFTRLGEKIHLFFCGGGIEESKVYLSGGKATKEGINKTRCMSIQNISEGTIHLSVVLVTYLVLPPFVHYEEWG